MSVLPRSDAGRVTYFQNRIALWTTNATAIGVTTSNVTALGVKTTTAAAAMAAAQVARDDAKSATLAAHEAVKLLTMAGSEMIKEIKVKAGAVGNSVYALANIPAPADPSPVAPPGTATDFKVGLEQDGSIILKFKCANPVGSVGTQYQVWRRIGNTGEFSLIALCGKKEFADTTVPAGSVSVTYRIIASRANSIGAPAQFTVTFGVGGGGEMTASLVEAPRIAA